MSSTMNANGRIRKSLAEQIDRLDQVLDGLAENLNEAVATAVKEAVGVAVKEAVQVVLTEILTNPAVRAKLGGVMPATQPASATPKPAVRERVRRVWGWIGQRMRAVYQAGAVLAHHGRQACVTVFNWARKGAVSVCDRLQIVRHFRVQLLTALAVGIAAGTAAYFAGPWLAAGVSAAGGFATTLAIQVGMWLRRTFGVSAVPTA